MNELTLEVLTDQDASSWLSSQNNFQSWAALYHACSWQTPTLTPDFFKLWLRHYGAQWRPILILGKSQKGVIKAIFPLALRDKLITGAGAHQAEYHGWLCTEEDSGEFLSAVLNAIPKRFTSCHFRLRYLAPGIPVDTLEGICKQHPRVVMAHHLRPLLATDKKAIEAALKKKGTRSKINRLNRQGILTFKRLTDADEISHVMDQIVAMYDFRQGAINDSCPFLDDPAKRRFYIDWAVNYSAEIPLHITCAMLNNRVISACIGVEDKEIVHLSILAHSPEFSSYSPGKIQIYQTAQLMVGEGFSKLDLTPGDDPWKERFATDHDRVFSLDAYPRASAALRIRLKSDIKHIARRILTGLGLSPREIKRLLNVIHSGPGQQARSSDSKSAPATATSREGILSANARIYRLTTPFPLGINTDKSIHCNALADLIHYEPIGAGPDRQSFLRQALTRLENGDVCYSLVDAHRLTCCVWITEKPKDSTFRAPVIHDIYVLAGYEEKLPAVIKQTLKGLKDIGIEAVYLITTDRSNNQWTQTLGFKPESPMIKA